MSTQCCAFEDIVILDELKGTLRDLSDDELLALQDEIEVCESIRDPLVVWEREGAEGTEYVLVDGHHRHMIASKMLEAKERGSSKYNWLNAEDIPVVAYEFESMLDAVDWINKNQSARRNLSEKEMAAIRGAEAKAVKAMQTAAKKSTKATGKPPKQEPPKLKDVAEKHDVSDRQLRRDEKFASAMEVIKENVDADLYKQAMDSKEISKERLISIAEDVPPQRMEHAIKAGLGLVDTDFEDEVEELPAETTQEDEERAWLLAVAELDKSLDKAVELLMKREYAYGNRENGQFTLELLAGLVIGTWRNYLCGKPLCEEGSDSFKIPGTLQGVEHVFQLRPMTRGAFSDADRVEKLPFRSRFAKYCEVTGKS